MKQTENYRLNQWDLTDRIRMEDFNSDNAKLEAALAGLGSSKPEYVTLMDDYKEVTNVTSCIFTFDGIMPWDCVVLFVRIDTWPSNDVPIDLYVGNCSDPVATNVAYGSTFATFPLRNKNAYITFLPIAYSNTISAPLRNPFERMTHLTLRYGNWLPFSGAFNATVTALK